MALDPYDELIKAGWRYVIVAKIRGIPWLFAETIPLRADSASAVGLPSGFAGVCPALFFDESVSFSQEVDRETGVARGDAVELCLAWEPLEEDGLTTTLFARPTKRTRLTADLTHSATSADVESTAGWTAGDRFYLGRETGQIGTITDADTFGGLARGQCGEADRYEADSPTSFSWLTDKPEVWAGRVVDVYRHLLSPEGRMVDATWTTGTWCRPDWSGEIDEPPRPTEHGMVLRVLPRPRAAARELGYEVGMRVVLPDPANYYSFTRYPIVMGPGSQVTITGSYTGPSSGTFSVTVPTIAAETSATIGEWVDELATDLDTALTGQPWYTAGECSAKVDQVGAFTVLIGWDTTYTIRSCTIQILPVPELYWLRPGVHEARTSFRNDPWINWQDKLAFALSAPVGAWLPVVQTEGEGWQDLQIPTSGAALVEVDGAAELVRWDRQLAAPGPDPRRVLLHLTERAAGGTRLVDLLGAADAELVFVSGHTGSPAQVLLTLLQSSGAGNRGTYDTLGVGLGCAIDEDDIDVAGILADPDLSSQPITAYQDGRTSIEDLLGGWLALSGRCLVQRRDTTGALKLTLVDVDPFAITDYTETLTSADVELTGIGTPEPIGAANEVKVSRDSIASSLFPVVVQDRIAIQASGPRSFEVSAPGMSPSVAVQLGAARIAAGLGISVVSVPLAPWASVQVGDLRVLALAHPATYDWATGTRAPARIPARMVGDRFTPFDGRRVGVFILAGILAEGVYLCPTATVGTVLSATELELSAAVLNDLFSPLDAPITVRLYNPGLEAAGEASDVDVLIGSASTLEIASGSWPAWVASGTRVTFTALGGGNDSGLDPAHLFQDSARRWGT